MIHQMRLNPSPFYMIKTGQKTIELRLNDEKRSLLNKGDEIEFINTEDPKLKLIAKITAIHHFDSFDELYKSLPLLKCGYTKEDIASAKASDMDVYYSREMQRKYGVLGIEIKVI